MKSFFSFLSPSSRKKKSLNMHQSFPPVPRNRSLVSSFPLLCMPQLAWSDGHWFWHTVQLKAVTPTSFMVTPRLSINLPTIIGPQGSQKQTLHLFSGFLNCQGPPSCMAALAQVFPFAKVKTLSLPLAVHLSYLVAVLICVSKSLQRQSSWRARNVWYKTTRAKVHSPPLRLHLYFHDSVQSLLSLLMCISVLYAQKMKSLWNVLFWMKWKVFLLFRTFWSF